MTNSPVYSDRTRLEMVLKGRAPDYPPHFEMLFQLELEAFGMDRAALDSKPGDPTGRTLAFEIEMRARVAERYGWAAVDTGFPGADTPEGMKRLQDAIGGRALIFAFNGQGTFWMPPVGTDGIEMTDFASMLYEEPEQLHEVARRKCKESIELARRQAGLGVDFIIMNSDYAYNQAPFISPDHFREFVTPYLAEIVAAIHELGLPVLLHSDGNLNKILDQIHSTGVDGHQSVDPQGGMDLARVRAAYPDWVLMGNVACNLLQDVDEEQIRLAVRDCMRDGGIGRRYIFSTSNCVFKGMPLESYEIMHDEYRRIVAPSPVG